MITIKGKIVDFGHGVDIVDFGHGVDLDENFPVCLKGLRRFFNVPAKAGVTVWVEVRATSSSPGDLELRMANVFIPIENDYRWDGKKANLLLDVSADDIVREVGRLKDGWYTVYVRVWYQDPPE